MTRLPHTDAGSRTPLGPTSVAVIALWAVAGVNVGFVVRLVADAADRTPPLVSWGQPLSLFFVAAVLGGVAWQTHRLVHGDARIFDPMRLVNRLVLAKACIMVGALLAGAYAAYAVTWLNADSELGDQRLWRSVACVVAAIAIVVASVFLERACRIRQDPEAS